MCASELRKETMKRLFTLMLWLTLPFTFAQSMTVFAASSLTEAFEEMAQAFEDANPGVTVNLNFAGSSTLSTQISQGAPADVFASADEKQMEAVAVEVEGTPRRFAGNSLVIVTPEGSSLSTPKDLVKPGTLLVLAGPDVPAGRYALEVLENLNALYGDGFSARVLENLVSEETNVRQAAAKVALGEADAAIVYATDAAVLEGVRIIDIPEEANVEADYTIAVIKGSAQRELGERFLEFVLSDEGRAILTRYGFRP